VENVFDALLGELTSEEGARALASDLGTDPTRTATAARSALATLFAALSRNAEEPSGSHALLAALDEDHRGSGRDDPGGIRPAEEAGEAILGHVLGGRRQALERAIGQDVGLDPAIVGRLLAILAPLVMSALGRAQREHRLGAQELSYELERGRQRAETSMGARFGPLGGIVDGDAGGRIDPATGNRGKTLLKRLLGR